MTKPTKPLEPGFYWVVWLLRPGWPQVAELAGGAWFLVCLDATIPASEIRVLSPRLEPPVL